MFINLHSDWLSREISKPPFCLDLIWFLCCYFREFHISKVVGDFLPLFWHVLSEVKTSSGKTSQPLESVFHLIYSGAYIYVHTPKPVGVLAFDIY